MNQRQIPQAHRDAIAHIQTRAMAVSTQGTYWVSVQFSGMLLQLNVGFSRCADLHSTGNRPQMKCVTLPPCPRAAHDSLEQLQAIARELEALLPGLAEA